MISSIDIGLGVALLAIFPIVLSFWLKKSSYRSIQDRHVVITGGSAGIGLSIAIHCVKLGAHVTIIARDAKKMESAVEKVKLYRVSDKQRIQSCSIDLAKSNDAVKELFDRLGDEIAPIYWLVNCAGGVMRGRIIDHLFSDDDVYLMNVKYYAVYYPTRIMWTKMKSTGEGIITIIGSEARDLIMEYYGHGPYGTCLLSSHGLAETISMKGPHSKISVTLALVDHTDTTSLDNAEATNSQKDVQLNPNNDDSDKFVDMAYKIVHDSLNGRFISVSGWENWLSVTVWKADRMLRIVLRSIRQMYWNKFCKVRAQVNMLTDSAQLVSKPIDPAPLQSNRIEASADQSPTNVMREEADVVGRDMDLVEPVTKSSSNSFQSTCGDNESVEPQTGIQSDDLASSAPETIPPEDTTTNKKVVKFFGSSNALDKEEADTVKPEANADLFKFNFSSSNKRLKAISSTFDFDSHDNAPKKAYSTSSSLASSNLVSSSTVESTTNSNAQDNIESKSTNKLLNDFKVTSNLTVQPGAVSSDVVHNTNSFANDIEKGATAIKAMSFNVLPAKDSFGFSALGVTGNCGSFGFSATQPKNENGFGTQLKQNDLASVFGNHTAASGLTSKIPVVKPFAFSTFGTSNNPFDGGIKESDEKNAVEKTAESVTTGKSMFANPTEKSTVFSFEARSTSDASQPFMFGAKSTDDVSNKPDSSVINIMQNQRPSRTAVKRHK